MESKYLELAKQTKGYWAECIGRDSTVPVLLEDLETLADGVIRLAAELSDLKKQYRWRKQEEEPAPKDTVVLVRYLDYDGPAIALAPMEDFFDGDSPVYPNIEWRPLDLPEEEKNDDE